MNKLRSAAIELDLICAGLDRAYKTMNILLDSLKDDLEADNQINDNSHYHDYPVAFSFALNIVEEMKSKLETLTEQIMTESRKEECI